ncbi:MAG: hypothetical protein AAF404_09130, partial [Pseudomonadota bacterium]
AAYDNPTPVTIRAAGGDPLIAAVRLVDHESSSGDFTLEDGAGDDLVLGAAGNDTVNSGSGNDYIDTGDGNDIINDAAGRDAIYGGKGDDIINDGGGNDTTYAGAGNDTVTDGQGNDTHYGWGGDDTFYDGSGSDTIYGGADNDTIYILESSATDFNVFDGGSGDDNYMLPNHVYANFELNDSSGIDSVVLDYDAARGDSTYFLPDNFTFNGTGVDGLTGDGSTGYTLGSSTYSNPVAWDLSEISYLHPDISVQGGLGDDRFGLAFSNTEYRGGAGTDIVRVYGNATDYSVNRSNYIGPNTSDDTQYITLFSGTDSDILWDTIEFIDFDDRRYDIANNVLTTRPATIANVGTVPAIIVEHGETGFIDLSALNLQDSELRYAVNNTTAYNFWLGANAGTLSVLDNDGSTQTAAAPAGLVTTQTITAFNQDLDDPAKFSFLSDTSSTPLTDTLRIGFEDPNKTTVGGSTSFIDIPISILHDPVLANIETSSLVYNENDPAVLITSAITLTDPNTTPIVSATITLLNHSAGEDVLSFTDTATITSSYDAATGTLTLTGDDTVASYQAALRSVTYLNTSENPQAASRTIEITVNDGHDDSNIASRTLGVNNINDQPSFSSLTVATTDEDTLTEFTLSDMLALSNANDIDGTIDTFIVNGNSSGTLRIGADAATAQPFTTSSNDRIDALNNAYWTPDSQVNTPANGIQSAFQVQAQDDDGAIAATIVALSVNVNDVNDAPTFSSFSTDVDTTDEDAEVQITLAELVTAGNATDVDGTVDAMVVKTIDSGTLRLGSSSATATDFATGTNDTIDAVTHAYWTPEANRNTPVDGIQQAFSVVAQDDDLDESATAVTASVLVNDINDEPAISSFSATVTSTDEDTETQITLTQLLTGSDATDIDGSIDAIVVNAVLNGSLQIGTDAIAANPYASGSNDTIDNTNHGFWLPASNVNTASDGDQIAFFAAVKDDDNAESGTSAAAIVQVNDVNDPPVFTAFTSDVASTDEDTTVEMTLAALLSISDASDVDGTISNMKVQSVSSGTLAIGTDASSATAFMAGSNDTISSTLNAYWTPDADVNTTVDGPQSAFSVLVTDNDNDTSGTPVTATVQVNDINDVPTLTTFTGDADNTPEDTEVELSFGELMATSDASDSDGSIDALVVTSVESGSLKIGTTAALASAFSPGTNDTIDAARHAFWTPAPDNNTPTDGTQQAFTVIARDDDNDISFTA